MWVVGLSVGGYLVVWLNGNAPLVNLAEHAKFRLVFSFLCDYCVIVGFVCLVLETQIKKIQK